MRVHVLIYKKSVVVSRGMALRSRLDVGEIEKTLKGLMENSEVYKIETLWWLSLSSTSTGINSHRDFFKKNFLDHSSKYLEIKYGENRKKFLKEISEFLGSLSKKANVLSEKRYDPVSEVRKELKKIREILEDNKECRNILTDFIRDNYPFLGSVKKEIIKYLAVGVRENISESYIKSVLRKKLDDEHDLSDYFKELRKLKFESGLFLSKTYIKGSSQYQRKDHKAQSIDFF